MLKDMNFKVIIWGHKLHSHTQSYIHNGFYKGFKHMGFETYWFDDNDDIRNFDFSESLFVTEGQVDEKIPIREDCYYVLHNCSDKYKSLYLKKRCLAIQVYTDAVLGYNLEKLDECIYFDLN